MKIKVIMSPKQMADEIRQEKLRKQKLLKKKNK